MKTLTSLAFAVCLAVPGTAFAQSTQTTTAKAPAADASGTWSATFNTQNGQIPATLKLQKGGDKFGGTIASQQGETPVEATVEGKTLTVWFNYQSNGNAVPIVVTGTIDGDTVKGTFTAGGTLAGDWSATREGSKKETKDTKEPAPSTSSSASIPSLSGAWTINLVLDTINATPSLTVKQEGDKLTGEYVSQLYGKFPMTGSVKGSDVTFSVSLNIEGNAFTATYTGKLQDDGSLKGSVNFGDQMSGTFVATRRK